MVSIGVQLGLDVPQYCIDLQHYTYNASRWVMAAVLCRHLNGFNGQSSGINWTSHECLLQGSGAVIPTSTQ